MKKTWNCLVICTLITAILWGIMLLSDRVALHNELIRLHIVANSDSAEDQKIKLQVRDAVLRSLETELANLADVEAAKAYLMENLPKIQSAANTALKAAGFCGEAVVTLCQEAFDTREYETFTLPAGIYESLRIVIGEGEGKNWWCVAFPSLCLPATSAGFQEAAVEAGLSVALTATLAGETKYEVRFFLLDALGKLENYLFAE